MRGTTAVLVCLISLQYLSVTDAYSARFTSENGMPGREHEDKYPRRAKDVKRSVGALPDGSLNHDESLREDYGSSDYNHLGPPPYYFPFPDEDFHEIVYPVPSYSGQYWGSSGMKSSEKVRRADAKRKIMRNASPSKRAMESRGVDDNARMDKGTLVNYFTYLNDMAEKALDFSYDIVNGIDVSSQPESEQGMKNITLKLLNRTKEALQKLTEDTIQEIESGSDLTDLPRRIRSVGKRTNARDGIEPYLTGLGSKKRSKLRKSLRGSTKRNTPTKRSDMAVLWTLMTKMEDCINKMPENSSSLIGIKCVISPLAEVLASLKKAGASGSSESPDSAVRSNKFRSSDRVRKANLPWGNIFLIPIYDNHSPGGNTTTTTTKNPPATTTVGGSKFDNVTTTTIEPTTSSTTEPTTTTTTSTTTEASAYNYGESDSLPVPEEVPHDSRYRSKYDSDF